MFHADLPFAVPLLSLALISLLPVQESCPKAVHSSNKNQIKGADVNPQEERMQCWAVLHHSAFCLAGMHSMRGCLGSRSAVCLQLPGMQQSWVSILLGAVALCGFLTPHFFTVLHCQVPCSSLENWMDLCCIFCSDTRLEEHLVWPQPLYGRKCLLEVMS